MINVKNDFAMRSTTDPSSFPIASREQSGFHAMSDLLWLISAICIISFRLSGSRRQIFHQFTAGKNFPTFMATKCSSSCLQNPTLGTILSQLNIIHIFIHYFLKIYSNIILTSNPTTSK